MVLNINYYDYDSNDRNINHIIAGITCNLMKYEEFCLNVNQCKLKFDNIDKKDLYFSFARWTRYLIYTKIRKDKEDLYSTALSKTSLNISKIKKIFLIKSLNKKEYIIPYIIDNKINIPKEFLKYMELRLN